MAKLSEKEKIKIINKLKKTVRNLRRRNPKDINEFIEQVNHFEVVIKGSIKKIKELDKEEREGIFNIIDIYLEGFETLKKMKYKFSPQMEREYLYMKKVRIKRS